MVEVLKQKKAAVTSPSGSVREDEGNVSSNLLSSSNEGEQLHRRSRRWQKPSTNSNDFRVEIAKFEGKLDPNEFIEWLSTVKQIFEYEEIQEDKKVKLVALRLRKYASSWWIKLCAKRVRNRKDKIRTWEKIKANLIQESMNMEEYTREFEKLLIK